MFIPCLFLVYRIRWIKMCVYLGGWMGVGTHRFIILIFVYVNRTFETVLLLQKNTLRRLRPQRFLRPPEWFTETTPLTLLQKGYHYVTKVASFAVRCWANLTDLHLTGAKALDERTSESVLSWCRLHVVVFFGEVKRKMLFPLGRRHPAFWRCVDFLCVTNVSTSCNRRLPANVWPSPDLLATC